MMGGGSMNAGINNNYFPNAHGATGKILKLEAPNIIVEGRDNIEKVILINDKTKIQEGKMTVGSDDLRADDFVVVIGNPNNQGVIEAKLIRIVPSPEFLNN